MRICIGMDNPSAKRRLKGQLDLRQSLAERQVSGSFGAFSLARTPRISTIRTRQIETFVSLSQGLHDLDARVDPFTPLDIGGDRGQPE